MQKAAPIESLEGDADPAPERPSNRAMTPLTHSPMHAEPAPGPEQPALPRRSALLIEILAFVLIAFLVVSALMFNLTASRPLSSGSSVVSVPLPPKPEPVAVAISLPAPGIPEPSTTVREEAPATTVQEVGPATTVRREEPTTAASLPEVEPQAGPTVAPSSEPEPVSAHAEPPPEGPPPEVAALPPVAAPVVQELPTSIASEPAALPPPAPAEETAAVPLPAEDVAALLRRGDALLATGDIVAARASYERAAVGGNRMAAMGVAKTYDPIFLMQTGVRGLRGNPARAALWYGKAAAAGDRDAQQRLQRLRAQYPQ